MGSAELDSEPDLPDRPEQTETRHSRVLRMAAREIDPDERGQAFDAARAYASADAVEQRDYRAEVPRFERMWAEHEERWPVRDHASPATGRTVDPEGSFRSDGGFYLGPEQNMAATDAIDHVRKAEPAVSADLRAVERQNTSGARLEGFDCRLKGDDRLKEKTAEQLDAEPSKTADDALGKLPDAIRYTFCLEPENYSGGYYDIKGRLESLGYEMYQSKNSWNHPEYKGVNTRWVTQDGLRFEVQFHTPESFDAKQNVTHGSYERLRNPLISDVERKELRAFQREVSTTIAIPDHAADILDFKKDGL